MPNKLCDALEELIHEVRRHLINNLAYMKYEGESLPERVRKEKHQAWEQGWTAINNEIPLARKTLEDEFRALLGATRNPSL